MIGINKIPIMIKTRYISEYIILMMLSELISKATKPYEGHLDEILWLSNFWDTMLPQFIDF